MIIYFDEDIEKKPREEVQIWPIMLVGFSPWKCVYTLYIYDSLTWKIWKIQCSIMLKLQPCPGFKILIEYICTVPIQIINN